MDTRPICDLFDELATLGTRPVAISGGEPTTHPDLAELVECAQSRSLGVGVLTNGLGIGSELAGVLAHSAAWLRISVDGSDEDAYRRFRKPVDGDYGIEAIRKSVSEVLRRIPDGGGCRIGICYRIQRKHIDGILSMIDFVRTLELPEGTNTLTFKFVHGNNGFRCTQEQINRFGRDILQNLEHREKANLGCLERCLRDFGSTEDVAACRPSHTLYTRNRTRCFTPQLNALGDAQGGIYPCCYLHCDNESEDQQERTSNRLGVVSGYFRRRAISRRFGRASLTRICGNASGKSSPTSSDSGPVVSVRATTFTTAPSRSCSIDIHR